MDPFSALSIASIITQFVDFSCQLFSQTKDIYHSASGSSAQVNDITLITNNLLLLSSRLTTSLSSSHSSQVPHELKKLAERCRDDASEILAGLERFRSRQPQSRWRSFRAALAIVWGKEKLERIKIRLEDSRRQMALLLSVMQNERESAIIRSLDELYRGNVMLQTNVTNEIRDFRSSVVATLERLQQELNRQDGAHRTDTAKADQSTATDRDDVESLAGVLAQNAKRAAQMSIALHLLRRLRFSSMSFRYSKITEAHLNTFQWMFSQNLVTWLRTENPIFWVSGKPGSGKSTLMKYLVDNAETYRNLQTWAGNHKLVTASHFFWINGSELQRSQEGLLQSLLFDILRQCPDLTQTALPHRWRELEMESESKSIDADEGWTRKELLEAFAGLFKANSLSTRFCIFIDGLDEYDGDHEELIHVIKGMVQTNNVKFCVASRPWNVFEAGFGEDQMHKLYLEQLNRPDIEIYVENKLKDRPDFREMSRREPKTGELADEVVSKSQGVFLWVFLVVQSLVRGLQNADRLQDLQRRLRAFPSDLNEFFNHILMSLEDVYRVQAARNFQVALDSPRPLSLLNYWFMDVEDGDPDYVYGMRATGLSPEDVLWAHEDMRKRINGRSKGLLEVTFVEEDPGHLFSHSVDFLHRTVKDFLMTKDAQSLLKKWASVSGFDPRPTSSQQPFSSYESICKSCVAVLKKAPTNEKCAILSDSKQLQDFVHLTFVTAELHEKRTGEPLITLLNHLGQTIPLRYQSRGWHAFATSIDEYAVMWNLRLYTRDNLAKIDKLRASVRCKNLLLAAVKGCFDQSGNIKLQPDPEFFEQILGSCSSLVLHTFEMNQIVGWMRQLKLPGYYPCLLQLFSSTNVEIEVDDSFWTELSQVLSADEVSVLKRVRVPAKVNVGVGSLLEWPGKWWNSH